MAICVCHSLSTRCNDCKHNSHHILIHVHIHVEHIHVVHIHVVHIHVKHIHVVHSVVGTLDLLVIGPIKANEVPIALLHRLAYTRHRFNSLYEKMAKNTVSRTVIQCVS